jgi:ssDNA-binding Zn-finger/Zn-ribbon topoisomerase 1
MEEELDEIARGEREWVPLLRAFYGPLRDLVDEKRKVLRRRDFTTEPTDEVCSLGHPMVIRLGRNGRFLACSMYPEHKESRPLPGEEQEVPALPGVGEPCPQCGESEGGHLAAKRGRFGPFVGCDRYPDCTYIQREGPPPPEPLPFVATCPKCKEGHLVPRRARKTGSVFWGCSRYPKCDWTTWIEPVGAVHDADEGAVGRPPEGPARCLACGAPIELPEDTSPIGLKLPGGEPDEAALARPSRRGGGRGGRPAGRGARGPRRTGRTTARA